MRALPLPERLRASDARWCAHANALCARRAIRRYFALVSRLGDGVSWYALMGVLVLADGWAGLLASVHMAATGIVALACYRTLKRHTKRKRPFAADPGIRAWVAPLDEFSFPSGHTLHAVAFGLVAMAHYPLLAWVLVPFVASIGASRVVLGLHYPSDVAAATALGAAIASLSLWLVPGASLFG